MAVKDVVCQTYGINAKRIVEVRAYFNSRAMFIDEYGYSPSPSEAPVLLNFWQAQNPRWVNSSLFTSAQLRHYTDRFYRIDRCFWRRQCDIVSAGCLPSAPVTFLPTGQAAMTDPGLCDLITTMPEKQQQVLRAYYWEKISLTDIDQEDGVTRAAVFARHQNALDALRTKLGVIPKTK